MQRPSAAVVIRLTLMYIKSSLIYLVLGISLIVLSFALHLPFERDAFFFMQLYGFVAMMIFGLSYVFIPAFAHGFLHSLRVAKLQFWMMNVGVIGLTVSFSGLLPSWVDVMPLTLGSFLIQAAAIYLHAYNIWRTLEAWKGSPGEKLSLENARR